MAQVMSTSLLFVGFLLLVMLLLPRECSSIQVEPTWSLKHELPILHIISLLFLAGNLSSSLQGQLAAPATLDTAPATLDIAPATLDTAPATGDTAPVTRDTASGTTRDGIVKWVPFTTQTRPCSRQLSEPTTKTELIWLLRPGVAKNLVRRFGWREVPQCQGAHPLSPK